MQNQSPFIGIHISILISLVFCSFAASNDDSYSWQPVQTNMRLRHGDYQTRISTENDCKSRCVSNPTCIGIDWFSAWESCFLLYDSNASPHHEVGYRHWRLIRNRRTTLPSIQGAVSTTATTTTPTTTTATTTATAITTTVRSDIDIPIPTSDTGILITINDKSVISERTPDPDIDDSYSWLPVQHNARFKTGDYQAGIREETSCKGRCVQNLACVGIDWHTTMAMCFLLYDCHATPYPEIGYSHWEVRRYKRIPVTCQDLVHRFEASIHPNLERPMVFCDSEDKLKTVVKVLSVLLCVATTVIFALLFNTCRLNRKLQNRACKLKNVDVARKIRVQENGYQIHNQTAYQSVGYLEIVGSETPTPIPYDSENLYDAIDDVLRL